MLFVGGSDDSAIEMNHQAMTHLAVEHRLETVPGATHLFEEPGALEQVPRLAADWLARRLAAPRVRSDDR